MNFLQRLRRTARARSNAKLNALLEAKTPPVKKPYIKECKWPHGHVGEKDFHFCCKEALPGRSPYCEEHTKIAYRRPPAKRTESQLALIKAIKVGE